MKKTADFWVGDRIVRPSLGEIRLGMERVRLEPRSMEVLIALARRAPEVAPKQELVEEVWGETFVSDEVLTHAIWDLRRAFGDKASNPEFIQTIPKRGYRLIAPVKEIGSEGEAGEVPKRFSSYRYAVLGILGIAALLVGISIWVGRTTSPGQRAQERKLPIVLTLVPTSATSRSADWAKALDKQLHAELAGTPGVHFRLGTSCGAGSKGEIAYCLEPHLQPQTGGYQASVGLKEVASSNLIYATPFENLASRADLEPATKELAELVRICLEVLQMERVNDPDIRPWISFQDHDIRAIRDFLLGVDYVYRNEVGASVPFESAIKADSRFIAPWVWRTPTIVGEGNPAAIAEHRAGLSSLYDNASSFEKAMIDWATAIVDGMPSEQLRHLRVALDQKPGNSPVQLNVAIALLQLEDVDGAWHVLEALLEEKWCFPALYPLAARCAVHLGRVDDAQSTLELALDCDPIDPDTLALLHVLAIYDENAEDEAKYGDRLERRKAEMLPEKIESDVSSVAGLLAALAESEGRQEIADRLRESAN